MSAGSDDPKLNFALALEEPELVRQALTDAFHDLQTVLEVRRHECDHASTAVIHRVHVCVFVCDVFRPKNRRYKAAQWRPWRWCLATACLWLIGALLFQLSQLSIVLIILYVCVCVCV